eukprot:1189764-Prorocentrum_minimum.AAC.2
MCVPAASPTTPSGTFENEADRFTRIQITETDLQETLPNETGSPAEPLSGAMDPIAPTAAAPLDQVHATPSGLVITSTPIFSALGSRLETLTPLGLDTDTVELTIKTLLSHLITRTCNLPTNSLRTPYVHVEPSRLHS